jgi:hypothetical protein
LGIGANPDCTVEVVAATPKPPIHPVEVRISIGGDDWQYVRGVLSELAAEAGWRDADSFHMMSGGAGGSYSATVAKRNVTPEQFRKELDDWFTAEKAKAK